MKDFRSSAARGVTPYVCGEQPDDREYIKLNANENAYPPSPRALQALREDGILVRHFSHPRLENYLRITVGTDEQMDRLIAALKEFL